ncbi:MAG: DUF4912 domain-containing protein [Elusimicrobiota bacterium]|nr:DUF4912 domain-containing protein [Elusimicrobiota bacterium]
MAETSSSVTSRMVKEKREVRRVEELPTEYGDVKIALLSRDPYWMFAYWEVNQATREELKRRYGDAEQCLRVYDVTGIEFNGKNAHKQFDITLTEDANNWYINVPEVNRSWCVEFGLRLSDGTFIPVVRSNVVNMPRYGVSPITDSQWAILQKEFERLLKLSGVEQIGKSSFDVAKLMRERWEEIVSISSAQMPFSPRGISSFRVQPEIAEVKPKEFWLKADTDLIVYGTTESDAELKVSGEKVNLNHDGSFSLRFALTDGEKEIPIEATSSDKKISKRITFDVTRKTR